MIVDNPKMYIENWSKYKKYVCNGRIKREDVKSFVYSRIVKHYDLENENNKSYNDFFYSFDERIKEASYVYVEYVTTQTEELKII